MWLYPDGSRILELSTRAATNEAFQVAAETRAFLAEHGVDLSGEQETKTRKALEYFAGAAENWQRSAGSPERRGVAGIVPRWEWRTFGESFGAAEGLLDLREAERVQESDELYLLSQESDASVKVRDGLMDVKRLEAVDGNGLEQWRPVLKGSFPLGADDVADGAGRARRLGPELDARCLHARAAGRRGGRSRARLSPRSPCTSGASTTALGGCMAELSEVDGRHPVGPHDRRRGRGSRARRRHGARAAARRAAERLPRTRAQDDARVSSPCASP